MVRVPRLSGFPAADRARAGDQTLSPPSSIDDLLAALRLHQAGRLADADTAYRSVLRREPNHPDALHLLGVVLQQQGHAPAAIALIRSATLLSPDFAEAHYNQGNAFLDTHDRQAAAISFHRAVAIRPDYAEAHANLGNALANLGETAAARDRYRRSLACHPGNAEALSNLGAAMNTLGAIEAAAAQCRRAVLCQPANADALSNLGNALAKLGCIAEAIGRYREAVAFNPALAAAWSNLGKALAQHDRADEAILICRRAVVLVPDFVDALCNLAGALANQARFDDAIQVCRILLTLDPPCDAAIIVLAQARRQICDWRQYGLDERRLLGLVRTGVDVFPFIPLAYASTAVEQHASAHLHARGLDQPLPHFSHSVASETGRLRLGYLSGDLHSHATAYLTAELFERHDRASFEIVGYSYGPDDGSAIRQRVVKAFDQFVELRDVGHAAAAERIYRDGIDILVDLKGYTGGGRTEILVPRPAPIQVNFLGYPGTMGADFIDYIIADPIILPMDQQPHYTEKIVHLPDCYQPNDSLRSIADATPSRQDCGLPESGLVFCSFNNTFKITPAIFDYWMHLLKAVPSSVLWLLDANARVRGNLCREAEARGVSANRLVFGPKLPLEDHLARHRLADLFLDTLPYNAHTTASDSLWAGVPVLTCMGNTFAGRVAASLLRSVGLPELITTTLDDYAALAIRLAQEPAKLLDLRDRLARNRLAAPLFDSQCYTRHLEAAYRHMWELYRAGLPPQSFALDAGADP